MSFQRFFGQVRASRTLAFRSSCAPRPLKWSQRLRAQEGRLCLRDLPRPLLIRGAFEVNLRVANLLHAKWISEVH